MDEPVDVEKEVKRDWRRFWLLLGGMVLFMLGLVAYVVFVYDIAPPDDEWLLCKPFPPSQGPNSIPEFVKTTGALLEASDKDRIHLREDERTVSCTDLTKVRDYLAKHDEALKRWNAFAEANHGPVMFPGGDKGLSFTTDQSHLSVLQKGANLAVMKARLLAREGKVRESLEQSLLVMRLGQQLCLGQSSKIQWLVGMTLEGVGRSSLEFAANLQLFDTAELDLLEKTLTTLEVPANAYKATMQAEYHAFKNTLQPKPGASRWPGSLPDFVNYPWWAVWSFKRNLTMATFMDMEQPIFKACGEDWCKAFAATRELTAELDARETHPLSRLMNANIGGNMLVDLALSTEGSLVERSVRTTAFHRQMQIIIALRRYEMEHGKPPEKLEMLCPKFLPAVPLDPYDNQPMRWNSATMAVYALGKDLHDDGGKIRKPSKSDDKDIGMFYWWAQPPAATPASVGGR